MIVLACQEPGCEENVELEDGALVKGIPAERWFSEERGSRCKAHYVDPMERGLQLLQDAFEAKIIRETVNTQPPAKPAPISEENRARDEAIQRAADNADPEWKERARKALEEVARSTPEFISDDIWKTGLEKPTEARALGDIMRWGVRQGLMKKTNKMQESTQVGNHRRPMQVWESCVFKA